MDATVRTGSTRADRVLGSVADQALIQYQEAILIAERAPAPVVAMQARLGMASALFHAESYERAAQAYEQAQRMRFRPSRR